MEFSFQRTVEKYVEFMLSHKAKKIAQVLFVQESYASQCEQCSISNGMITYINSYGISFSVR